MSDPMTPEGRAELRRIATDGWMIRPHQVLALLDELDRQERELAGYRAEEQRVREWNALVAEGNVRCTYCDLRYAEREEYPCGDARDQNSHHYDSEELAEARRSALDGDS